MLALYFCLFNLVSYTTTPLNFETSSDNYDHAMLHIKGLLDSMSYPTSSIKHLVVTWKNVELNISQVNRVSFPCHHFFTWICFLGGDQTYSGSEIMVK